MLLTLDRHARGCMMACYLHHMTLVLYGFPRCLKHVKPSTQAVYEITSGQKRFFSCLTYLGSLGRVACWIETETQKAMRKIMEEE